MRKSWMGKMLLGVLAGMCFAAVPVMAEEALPENVQQDIAYVDDDNKYHLLDIYESTAEETKGTIIEVHGGGYIGGSKATNMDHSIYYSEKGFQVVTPNYTLLPHGDFKTAVQDLFTMYNWVGENAEEYGFDTDNIFISGDSAGGYYVLLTAAIMSSGDLQQYFEVTVPEYEVKGYVATCPGTDVLAIRDALGTEGPSGFVAETIGEEILMNDELMEHLDLYSIIDTEAYPYIYMLTTPEDITTGSETLAFEEFLTENGVAHELHTYENEENELLHVFNIIHTDWVESIKANDDIVAYLEGLCG